MQAHNDHETPFPAGPYYVGDLCYVLTEVTWKALPCPPGDGESWRVTVDGHPAWMGWTAYGDGVFVDQDGYDYGVDSGSLGVLPVAACDVVRLGDAILGELGRVVLFTDAFVPTCTHGRFTIGHLIIETNDLGGNED